MKRNLPSLFKFAAVVTLALLAKSSFAGVVITSAPDTIASLNQVYTYDVNAAATPEAATYSLITKPTGMTINATTGLISWTPTSLTSGGKVVVRATNSSGNDTQTFYLYVSSKVVCDPNLVSYWPMDKMNGTSLPDVANGYDAIHTGNLTATLYPGKVGKAAKFDPTAMDDWSYEVTDVNQYEPQYDTSFSVSLWFKNKPSKMVPPQSVEVMLAKTSSPAQARWQLLWATDNYVYCVLQDNSTTRVEFFNFNKAIVDTNWHFLAIVVALHHGEAPNDTLDSDFVMYIDGNSHTERLRLATENMSGNGPLTMGFWGDVENNTQSFSGYLDEVAYHSKKLEGWEVDEIYQKGLAGENLCQKGNTAPLFKSDPITSVNEKAAYSYQIKYRDIDGDPITKSATGLPGWLTFNTTTGILSGTPGSGDVGDHNITLRISDGEVNVDQVFTITVSNVNDLPVVSSTAVTSVNEDAAYSYTITATDADAGSVLTYSAPVLPSWLTFNTTTHVLSGTPTNNEVGMDASKDYNVTLRVTDDVNASTDQSFVITVHQVNDAPSITGQSALTIDEDNQLQIATSNLTFTDVDDNSFTLTVKDGTNYTHTGNTITPTANWNGVLTVPVELSDGEATVSYNVSVTVNAINDAPVFTSTAVTAAVTGTEYQYWITTSDVESSSITLSCVSKPAWLSFTSNAGSGLLTGTPTSVGTPSVTLRVSDGTTTTDQVFTITITGPNATDDKIEAVSSVYPVPASEYVNFEFVESFDKAALQIYSTSGELLKSIDISNTTSYQLDISDLKPSIYYYRVLTSKGQQSGPIIVK